MAGTTTDTPEIKIHQDELDVIDDGNLPFSLPLELTVRDRETIAALWQHEEGGPREQFALEALKIGMLALRQASGALDATLIRQEAGAWLKNIEAMLREHQTLSRERLAERSTAMHLRMSSASSSSGTPKPWETSQLRPAVKLASSATARSAIV